MEEEEAKESAEEEEAKESAMEEIQEPTEEVQEEQKNKDCEEHRVEEPAEKEAYEEKRSPVKGFRSAKFGLGFLTVLFTLIAAATPVIDMFMVGSVRQKSFFDSGWIYIKGIDIFKAIGRFSRINPATRSFVIASVTVMILVAAIGLIQFFVTILWRTKSGYIFMISSSIMAIILEAFMITMFYIKYLPEQYSGSGSVIYGPVIAIVLHIAIIILSDISRKLTKINSIVNR